MPESGTVLYGEPEREDFGVTRLSTKDTENTKKIDQPQRLPSAQRFAI